MLFLPEGYGQVTFAFVGSGVPTGAVVTMAFDNDVDQGAVALATAAEDNFGDNIMPVLAANVTLNEVLVKLGPSDTGPSAVVASTRGGGDVSAQASPAVSYLVHKVTNAGGRRGRGRMFLPGVDETEVSQAGVVTAAKLVPLQAALDTFLTRMGTDNMTAALLHGPPTVWVLVNGQPRRVPTGAAPGPSTVIDLVADATVGTQRRRQRR